MTLPASGPISLLQCANEFGLSPAGVSLSTLRGQPGGNPTGAIGLNQFHGQSAPVPTPTPTPTPPPSLTTSPSGGADYGTNSAQVSVGSTVSTNFSFTLLAGSSLGITTGPTSGTLTYVQLVKGGAASGFRSADYRVTSDFGYVDIHVEVQWDNGTPP